VDGHGNVPEIKYHYINKSGSIVKISVKNDNIPAKVADSILQVDDTIQFWDYTFHNTHMGPFGSPDDSVEVKLIFQGPQNRCLVYSGAIDTLGDIRSEKSYYANEWIGNKVTKYFTITEDHYIKGSQCP
jgi:hypothetical protein